MHAANIKNSPRLRRVRDLLKGGNEHSTQEIIQRAHVCAVNSIIAELRSNGFSIACRQATSSDGVRIWLYRMEAGQ